MNKTLNLLSGLLVVQIVLGLWLHVKNSNLETFVPDQPLFESNFEQLEKIKIIDKSSSENKEALELKNIDSKWALVYSKTPQEQIVSASQSKVASTIQSLFNQKRPLPVSENSSAWKKLGVSDENYEKQMVLSFKNGKEAQITFGLSPSFKKVYARISDSKNVYPINFTAQDLSLAKDDWIDKEMLYFDEAQISNVDLPTLKLSKVDNSFVLAGNSESDQKEELDQKLVDSLLRRLAKIDLSSVYAVSKDSERAKAIDYNKSLYKFSVGLANNQKIEMSIFDNTEDQNSVIVLDSRTEALYLVSKSIIEGLAKTDKSGLLKKVEVKPEAKSSESVKN